MNEASAIKGQTKPVRLVARKEGSLIEVLVFPGRVEVYHRVGKEEKDLTPALKRQGLRVDTAFSSPCG